MSEPIVSEEWRPVVGWEGWYSVSNTGMVRRERAATGTRAGRLGKPTKRSDGYWEIRLRRPGCSNLRLVHRLVAGAFLGPCPADKEVNHINGRRDDASIANLEYMTRQENIRHKIEVLGSTGRGEQSSGAILTDQQVLEIRSRYAMGELQGPLARKFGVTQPAISAIVNRKRWSHI